MLTARRALWFAKELGFHSLIVEGDSEIIINSINGNNMAQSEFGHIFYKTLSFYLLFLVVFLFTILGGKVTVGP